MREELIREFDGQKIIGIIRYEDNGDQTAMDFPSRKILGYYRSKQNRTTDFIGRVLTLNNTVVSLIFQQHKE